MTQCTSLLVGGIQYTEQLHEGRRRLQGHYKMPCGCLLAHAVVDFGSTPARNLEELLVYWFEDRVQWHQCHLVTADKPSGNTPRQDRKGPAPWASLMTRQRV